MKTSEHDPTHILLRAGSHSEWDNCGFALINCSGWQERIGKWLSANESFPAPEGFISFRYHDNSVDFYVSQDGEQEDLLGEEDWTFVRVEEGEEEKLTRPENRLEAASLVLYPGGSGFYKSYGKYSGEEFYTVEIPLKKIIEKMSRYFLFCLIMLLEPTLKKYLVKIS